MWDETAATNEVICVRRERIYFSKRGWTENSPPGKSVVTQPIMLHYALSEEHRTLFEPLEQK